MDLDLRDRVCVVTGGSSGIGLATATPLWLEPGGMLTGTAAEMGLAEDAALGKVEAGLLLGRLATPEEVAVAIVTLLSPRSTRTGSTVPVDGGHVKEVFT